MKKALLCIALVLVICVSVSSLETENWLSLGVSLNSIFEDGDSIENMYMGSLGLGLGLYSFFNNSDFGVFVSIDLFLPVSNSLKNVYAPITQLDFIIGPGYKYNINEKMNLHFAVGFNFELISLYRAGSGQLRFQDSRMMFGIGVDAGFQYDLTGLIHLSGGIKLNFNFANWITTESSIDEWTTAMRDSYGWVNDYAMFGVRPYVAIGIYSYGVMGFGKPAVY